MTRSSLVGAPLGPTMARLAVPGVIGALIQSSMMLLEAGFLRSVGTEALAAVAVVFPILMLAQMLSAGAIGGAVSGAVARAMGAGDQTRASSVLMAAIFISLFVGSLMGMAIILAGPAFYRWAGATNQVLAAASAYSLILFASIPVLWLFNMLTGVMRGTGDMVRAAICHAVAVCAYLLLANWLIPGQGVPLIQAMRWAALAMVLAYSTGLLMALAFIWRPTQPVRFKIKAFNWQVLGAVLRQGLLAGSQSVMTILYALIATALLSRYGIDWLAGYGLAMRLELVMVPVIFGIGSSLIAIVGAYVGAGQRARAISIAWRGVLANAIIVGLIGLLMAWQPQWWCATLASSNEVAGNCMQTLRTVGPFYGFFALGLGLYFASQGLNTLIYPVSGALIRLLIVASGLLWVTRATTPETVLTVIAAAMVCYGLAVAIGLRVGPWRPAKG